MKDLIIVGADGFAREAYYIACAINAVRERWNIKGFLSNHHVDLKAKKIPLPVLGTISGWQSDENEVFAMGIFDPKEKEIAALELLAGGARFVSLVHPHVLFCSTSSLGMGCVLGQETSVSSNTRIRDFVGIDGAMIGSDISIGSWSSIGSQANVATGSIGTRSLIGSRAVVLKNVGDNCLVEPGSVLFSSVKDGRHVVGCPAVKVRV